MAAPPGERRARIARMLLARGVDPRACCSNAELPQTGITVPGDGTALALASECLRDDPAPYEELVHVLRKAGSQ